MARFFRRGLSKIYWLTAVTGYNASGSGAPTTAEIAAGVDLSASVAAIAGFQLSNSPIASPDLSTTFTKTIPGEDTTQASTLTFYDDDTATVIRTALAKGSAGFVILVPYGVAVGKRAEVWPATTTGVNDTWDLGNDAARFVVGFGITNVPSQKTNIAS